ncbi:MAG: class I SAM-dependent methyltransferase [Friedmanniella sp.]
MEVRDVVLGHYGRADLEDIVLRALAEAGVDPARMSAADLGGLDQLHAGGRAATEVLLARLQLGPQTRLLDVGSGIGGPARAAAAAYGCAVVGVDLSPDFIRTADALTARVGLSRLVQYRVVAAESLGFEDASFDRAMLVHVGMNLPDKPAVFREVRRVLRPGGLFGLFEQVRTGYGPLTYPLPWAEDASTSFLADRAGYVEDLQAAGFAVQQVEDRAAATADRGGAGDRRLSPGAVFGPSFSERVRNNLAATRAGLLAPVLMVARAA